MYLSYSEYDVMGFLFFDWKNKCFQIGFTKVFNVMNMKHFKRFSEEYIFDNVLTNIHLNGLENMKQIDSNCKFDIN